MFLTQGGGYATYAMYTQYIRVYNGGTQLVFIQRNFIENCAGRTER